MKFNSISEVLQAATDKLASPNQWTQGYYARDSKGFKCMENSPLACCHCLVGVIISLTEDPLNPGIADKLGNQTLAFIQNSLKDYCGYEGTIYGWNDDLDRTFNQVKDFLSFAILQARAFEKVQDPGATHEVERLDWSTGHWQ